MSPLPERVLRELLSTAGVLSTLDSDGVRHGLPQLTRLLGGDLATYHRLDLAQGEEHSLAYPADTALGDQVWPEYSSQFGQDPLSAHYANTGDTRPRRISDVVDLAVFHRTAVYQHYYRRVPIKHQIALPVTGLPGLVVGFTVCRSSGNDFTSAHLEILALLGPHLARLHRQQQALRQDRNDADASPVPLPSPVPTQRASTPAAGSAECDVTNRPPATYPSAPPTRSGPVPSPTAALTLRERQVLQLIGDGRTSASIGRELDVSTRTIDKHLENAYRKLGVSGRVAALTATSATPA